jgi:hypothetical protein
VEEGAAGAAGVAGAVTSMLQYMGKLDPAGNTYMAVIIATVGAYITGNTFQKVKTPQSTE